MESANGVVSKIINLWPVQTNLTATISSSDRGDGEKILAMVALGLGSFLSGMLPAIISERNRRRFPLTTSLLLCFGAGILLATSLVHILPEVRSQMKSNFAEIALCGGFFLIYFIDEFIHYFFGEAIRHTHQDTAPNTTSTANVPSTNRNYGSLDANESEPLLQTNNHDQRDHIQPISNDAISHLGHAHVHCDSAEAIAEANARICHTNHTEPCAQATMTGTFGLFVALSLHSAIEGLAIGVQNSATKVLFLLGAVACHKLVMAFCLGLELRSNPQTNTLRAHLLALTVFALGAVFGIGIGMIIVDVPNSWTNSTLPVIQALAGGTLFYVTVCEVIPREKARWHQNSTRKTAGFTQFVAVFCGFILMCIINFYLDDEDS